MPKLPSEFPHKDNLSSVLSQAVNSVYDKSIIANQSMPGHSMANQTSMFGGPHSKARTVASSTINLELGRKQAPKKKVESIQRFDTQGQAQKKEEAAPMPSTKYSDQHDIYNKEGDKSFSTVKGQIQKNTGGQKGRFRKKEFVDHRNELVKQHEDNLKKAQSVFQTLAKEALPA